MYTIHPTIESNVLTPDGGVIECKHEAAAKRVASELNERTQEIERMRKTITEQQSMLCLYSGATPVASPRLDGANGYR